jgi:hypothetical protein
MRTSWRTAPAAAAAAAAGCAPPPASASAVSRSVRVRCGRAGDWRTASSSVVAVVSSSTRPAIRARSAAAEASASAPAAGCVGVGAAGRGGGRTVAGSAGLAVVCYATAVFSLNPGVALAGCALCGVSVALMWPGTLSMSASRFPAGGAAMFGVLAMAGDLGGALGPWMALQVSLGVPIRTEDKRIDLPRGQPMVSVRGNTLEVVGAVRAVDIVTAGACTR